MKYFFLKASPEGTKSPHLNNFLLIPAKLGMEGAGHLVQGRPLKVREYMTGGREKDYNITKQQHGLATSSIYKPGRVQHYFLTCAATNDIF
jgi:hypothetical protein